MDATAKFKKAHFSLSMSCGHRKHLGVENKNTNLHFLGQSNENSDQSHLLFDMTTSHISRRPGERQMKKISVCSEPQINSNVFELYNYISCLC